MMKKMMAKLCCDRNGSLREGELDCVDTRAVQGMHIADNWMVEDSSTALK